MEISRQGPFWGPHREKVAENAGLALGGGGSELGVDLAEHRADVGRHAGRNGAGGDGYEARHQSVLDQVLTALVVPDVRDEFHCVLSLPFGFLQFVTADCLLRLIFGGPGGMQ